MTPEQIKEAREHAQAALAYRPIHLKPATENEVMFARAVLALTEQQPEPVSDRIRRQLILGVQARLFATCPASLHLAAKIVDDLLARYTITARPAATDEKPGV